MRLLTIAALASLAIADTISTSMIATVTQTRTVMRVYTETKKAVTNSSMTSMHSSFATGSSSTLLWNANATTIMTTARPTTQSFVPASTAAAPGRVHLDSAIAAVIGGAAAMLVL